MLLRKQISMTGTWTTRLDFDPARPSYEAGIVLYWNLYTFASIGIGRTESGDGREIRITQPAGEPGTFKVSDKARVMLYASKLLNYSSIRPIRWHLAEQ